MTRTELINHFIQSNCYKSYLEIGVDDPDNNFNKVICESKTGVDPYSDKLRIATHWNKDSSYLNEVSHRVTSDEFFESNNQKFDIIFIDGLHTEEQCTKDIINALEALTEGGMILVHDCLPPTEECQQRTCLLGWWGTSWKSFASLRMNNQNLTMYTVDTDCGIGVIQKGQQDLYPKKPLNWKLFARDKKRLMNIVGVEEIIKCGKI